MPSGSSPADAGSELTGSSISRRWRTSSAPPWAGAAWPSISAGSPGAPGRPERARGRARALPRLRHLGREPAPGRHRARARRDRGERGPGGAAPRAGAARRRRGLAPRGGRADRGSPLAQGRRRGGSSGTGRWAAGPPGYDPTPPGSSGGMSPSGSRRCSTWARRRAWASARSSSPATRARCCAAGRSDHGPSSVSARPSAASWATCSRTGASSRIAVRAWRTRSSSSTASSGSSSGRAWSSCTTGSSRSWSVPPVWLSSILEVAGLAFLAGVAWTAWRRLAGRVPRLERNGVAFGILALSAAIGLTELSSRRRESRRPTPRSRSGPSSGGPSRAGCAPRAWPGRPSTARSGRPMPRSAGCSSA